MEARAEERSTGPAMSTRAAVLSLIGVFVLAYFLRYVLIPFVIAAAIAYLLRPAIAWVRRKTGLPRIVVLLAAYALVVVLIGGLGWWFADSLISKVTDLLAEAPQTLSALLRKFLGEKIQLFGQTADPDALAKQMIQDMQSLLLQPGTAMTLTALLLAIIIGVILTFVLLLYFLISGGRLAEGLLWLVPPRRRDRVRNVARRIDPVLRRYILGLIIIVVYTAAMAWVGLGLVYGLAYAPLISIMVGFLELIPIVGPAISIALIAVSAVQQGSLLVLIGFMGFAVALRISIDQVVAPLVLGRAVTLHPVIVIFAFLVGATLYGILGVLLAVPVAASAKIAIAAWYDEDPRG